MSRHPDPLGPGRPASADLRDRFVQELEHIVDQAAETSLVPDGLARACVRVLPFDGAGISFGVRRDGRIPLGASDELAATAERLQFAAGTGPCTTVQHTRAPVVASREDLRVMWPMYAVRLLQQTDYRSAVAVPVGGVLAGAVVLDLYSVQEHRVTDDVLGDVLTVAGLVGDELARDFAPDGPVDTGLLAAFDTAAVAARREVRSAVTLLAARHAVNEGAGLALLRGLALVHDLDLETAVEQLQRGDLTD